MNFEYDFSRMQGCPVKGSALCVKQFDVYNLTDTGQRLFLFSIPAPAGAKEKRKNITDTSKPLVFAPGKHLIGVSAVTNHGAQSDPRACSIMIDITP